ncbi:MAG: TIGR01244 family sulfur transferase [Pseudomonadota bacterium]
MIPRALSGSMSIAAQIVPDDLPYIVDLGFRSILSNRPDGEAEDQPDTDDLRRLAFDHGLVFAHLPVIAGAIDDTDVLAFEQTLGDLPTPILAFCRTGHRSAILWSLVMAREMEVEDIIATALDAECDISAFRPYLEAYARGEERL